MSDAGSGRTRVGVDIGGTFTDLVLIRRVLRSEDLGFRDGFATLGNVYRSCLCFLHWSTVNARLTASGSCWMTRKRVAAGPLIRRVPCSHLR